MKKPIKTIIAGTFIIIGIFAWIKFGGYILRNVLHQTEDEKEPVVETIENDSEEESEVYATSHKNDDVFSEKNSEVIQTEEISPLTEEMLKIKDIYFEKGNMPILKSYYPSAQSYEWETYDVISLKWIPADEEKVSKEKDELYREVSCFQPDIQERELMVRCKVRFTAGEYMINTARLSILEDEIESISIPNYETDANTYISGTELPVEITYKNGQKSTVQGLYGLYFISEESETEREKNSETIITKRTEQEYLYVGVEERSVKLLYKGNGKILESDATMIGTDKKEPDIRKFEVTDYTLSNIDKPVKVHVYIEAEDNITPMPYLSYAFLYGEETPTEEDWNSVFDFDAEIDRNGIWKAYCRDESGNIQAAEKKIIVVDQKAPKVSVLLENEAAWCMSNKIIVAAQDEFPMEYCFSSDELGVDSGWGVQNEYTVKKNGLYKIKVRDTAGNITEKEIAIDNIDSKKPIINKITTIEGE